MFKRLSLLNKRGWLCISLSAFNMILAIFFAYYGHWFSILSLLISFLMWVGIYDPRNIHNPNRDKE